MPLKIELGGGPTPREGFMNVDVVEQADIRHDLNVLPWPIADESVDEVYSSHCLEHLNYPADGEFGIRAFVREIARICKVGAPVEIRVPDAISEMAMCPGHRAVISINTMRHIDHIFPEKHWSGSARRLKLLRIEPGCDDYWFHMARKNPLFKDWTDDDILTWLPRTRHENRFHFRVESNVS